MYNLISTITDLPLLIGCKEFPNSPQGMQLIKLIQDFINEEYKYTGAQVTEAFRLAVKRSLFLDGKRIDPSTFGQHLSVNIVGQVLTAYKEQKQGMKARPVGYNPNQIDGPQKKLITPAESWELVLKWAKEEGKPPFAAPYIGAYNYLVDHNQIKAVKKSSRTGFSANMVSPERQAVEQYLIRNVINK